MDAFGIPDQMGVGGAHLAPGGAAGSPDLQGILRGIKGSVMGQAANTAALQATLAKDRAAGQLVVKVDDLTLWAWSATSTDATGAEVVRPTDVAALDPGRWLRLTAPGAGLSPSIQAGTATLVAGTVTVADKTITAGSVVMVTRKAALGTAVGVDWDTSTRTPGAPGSLTITSIKTDKTTEANDVSTIDYLIIG